MAGNKFNAKPVIVDGIRFASIKECNRFQDLRILERRKEISDLQPHPQFCLRVEDTEICKYIADSEYIEKGQWIVEDVKSTPTYTPLSRLKIKLFRVLFPRAQHRV